MFKILLKQEIRALLKSRRVVWSIAIFLILYASVFTLRVRDYDNRVQSYIKDVESFGDQTYTKIQNYSYIDIAVIKKPTLYSIFNEGDTHQRGTIFNVEPFKEVTNPEVRNQSTNLFFKEPINLDISFLITFFFSLFVLLITFDSVNREKEENILRLLFSYPITRSSYILKKMLGNMFFISLVFLIPYVLSAIYLIIAYNSVIDISFMWFLIYYAMVALIFLFGISLIGIFTSLITHSPNKSLIYALSIWIILILIIPTAYSFIANKAFENRKKLMIMQQNYNILRNDKLYVSDNIDDSINPNYGSHLNWNSGLEKDVSVIAEDDTNIKHSKYLKYYYENIYPKIQEQEKLAEQMLRINTKSEEVKPYLLFFAPNVQFETATNYIAMNSTADFINFRQDAIALRNKLMNIGIKDNWLFSKSYFSSIDTTYSVMSYQEYLFLPEVAAKIKKSLNISEWNMGVIENASSKLSELELNKVIQLTQGEYFNSLRNIINNMGPVKLDTSNIPRYSQKALNPLVLLHSIWINLAFMLLMSLLLFVINVNIFKKFDLR